MTQVTSQKDLQMVIVIKLAIIGATEKIYELLKSSAKYNWNFFFKKKKKSKNGKEEKTMISGLHSFCPLVPNNNYGEEA